MLNTTPEIKISSCKYKLFKDYPFYSYLADSLVFEQKEEIPTMGVSPSGKIFYNPKFVGELPTKQVLGVIVHELMHVALLHCFRTKNRDHVLWNVATDIVINNELIEQGFELPECGLIPKNNSIKINDIIISKISEKSAEDVYNELMKKLNNESAGAKGFDHHDEWYHGDNESNGNSKSEKVEIQQNKTKLSEEEVKKVVEAAAVFARLRGQLPKNAERIVESLRKPRINWRVILRNEVASTVKCNFTWSKPNKKFVWTGMSLPTLYGESVQVIVHVDTSASISSKDLDSFLSEIIGISRSYEGIEFRILAGDVGVHNDILITPGNYNKIRNIKLHGGGGTSHVSLFEYVKKYKSKYKTLICFTDGYTEWPSKSEVKTIVVICPEGTTDGVPQWAKVIKMN